MKNLGKINIAILTLILTLTYSCTSILDQEPVSITHPDVYWSSQSEAEQALAGSYALFKNAMTYQANFLHWGEFPAMTLMDSQFWITNYIEGSGNYVLPYRENTQEWKLFFRAANWAFTIEQYVEGMSEELFTTPQEKSRIIGEAAFVRALSYFYMTRIWGEIPIVHESIETSDQLITPDGYIVEVSRSPENEVLDYILEAVEKSIGLLEYASPGSRNWAITANKASAEALKAHALLWYASRNNNDNELVQQSIDAATSVINNSNTSLIDYVSEGQEGFERMMRGQSKTGLFEINISADVNESFRMNNADGNHTGLTLNQPILNGNNGTAPTGNPDFYGYEFMAETERETDVRKELFFNDFEDMGASTFPLKYSFSSDDPASEDPYARFSESNILIFRLADIYLLRAEAYTKLGQYSAAVQDLDLVRSQAGVPAYTGVQDRSNLIKAIFDERAIELVAEAHSAYDRIRMDYFEGVSWMNSNRKAKNGYFWPVSNGVIIRNPSIVQTEYWQGRL
ncbi:RagB/SusD family nutrient uptake outer membrane protein [Echinicola sp. CAU 1574]|uniref:RagB/SusD family nutrient uptake outer membrane protein n=1 Tax=Echinicola arenosa TaxID=2774144 RepID=A0ABR9AH65_9BACT|nr:RagB/SusD family nutrient uptake outer membrane protein [Echinicola arenosa]MBD8488071.1 RagB/SusD family nutrient uptake outer membrane protein [Echinicola arenosa]